VRDISQQKPDHHAWPSRLIEWGILLVMLYSVWVWAGLRPSFHVYAFYASLPIGLLLLLSGPAAARRAVWRDPVFWLGLLLNGYLILQWSNAGRELYLDPVLNQWLYSDAPRPGWPYSFDAAEAWQMVTWFVPAWIIVCAIRSPHIQLQAARRMLLIMIASAGLLALFGLVKYHSGTQEVYWVTPFTTRFFASFAYRNHAASFFGLMGSVAVGLFFTVFFKEQPFRRRAFMLMLSGGSFLLCLVGLVFSGSRIAVFFGGALSLMSLSYGFFRAWQQSSGVRRLHAISLLLLLVLLGAVAIGGMDKEILREEFYGRKQVRLVTGEFVERKPGPDLHLDAGIRILQARVAWEMWKDQPWFGVGGWGYKYLAYLYVPEEQWWVIRRVGFANVHVDLLQFLTEFGLVGFLPLAMIGLILGRQAVRGPRPDSLRLLSLFGLGLVLFHNLLDIPFRSPGLLYHWLAILAVLPTLRLKGHRPELITEPKPSSEHPS
jgi:O-antigen ligase